MDNKTYKYFELEIQYGATTLLSLNMLRIITDFDGPIMDVSERYYQVYLLCLDRTKKPEQEIQILSKAEFWAYKRSKTPEVTIGIRSGLTEDQAVQFSQLRKELVHQLVYLKYDVIIPTAIDALTQIQQQGIDLVVMTMRRDRELDYAFTQAPLTPFFPSNRRYNLRNDYVKTRDELDKPLLMSRAMQDLPVADRTWMIGDTEADIAAAKSQHISVIGVLSGIRDQSTLEKFQPDSIVANLPEAVALILAQISSQKSLSI
jgi:phosphoglycolate phosphatase-like HAD superfamily hydrolase